MKITKMITPYKKTTMSNKKNKYIVIHYVGGISTAKNNCVYYNKKDARDASAQYFVDDTGVYQLVEDKDAAWHCGAKSYKHKYCRNTNSIGIEMCLKKDSNGKLYVTDKTINTVGELVRSLMKKYNISKENIIRHYDVTGKLCPNCNGLLTDSTWKAFRDKLANSTSGNTSTPTSKNYLSKGDKGNDVKKMQEMLIKCGYSCGKYGADGDFGSGTHDALIKFQKDSKLTADGLYGANSKTKLESLYASKTSSSNTPSSNKTKTKELQTALNKDLKLKLAVDGIIGSKTTDAMKKVAIRKPVVGNQKSYPNITKFVQKYVGVSADGIYGADTKKAVAKFQASKKLTSDGVVGYNTLSALIK